ncbi:hypothetical protein ACJ41O_009283 [Fusarium nematophilum]
MQVILGTLLFLLLGSATAQQFADVWYDYDIDEYTLDCKRALYQIVECSPLLGARAADNIYLTSWEEEDLCTTECRDSLVQTQEVIKEACPATENKVMLKSGRAVTAQDNINKFLSAFIRTCPEELMTTQTTQKAEATDQQVLELR